MLSIDTNILLYAFATRAPENAKAKAWLQSLGTRPDVLISEFILAEFYLLLRNPAVLPRPLAAADAVAAVQGYRCHPQWKIGGFSLDSADVHHRLWLKAAEPDFARRRLYDVRTALSLQALGATEFATANEKDFAGLGFARVWNPLSE